MLQRDNLPNISLIFCIIYIYFKIATPHVRFDFLDTISYEKITILIIIFSLLLSNKKKVTINYIILIIFIFTIYIYLNLSISKYIDYYHPSLISNDYWKYSFFFYLLFISIDSYDDIAFFLYGIVLLLMLYQIHSWYDFLSGGSYVYQQGLKRMIGVWSGGGFGAANAWGSMGMFFMPVGYLYFGISGNNRKLVPLLFILLCILSVIMSGTRSCLICILIFFILYYRKKLYRLPVLFSAIVFLSLIIVLIPNELYMRYASIIGLTETSSTYYAQAIAEESAESRTEGLFDGYRIFLSNPVFGAGPGSSPYARLVFNDDLNRVFHNEGRVLQLHNLYGQLIAELGCVGLIIFTLLCSFSFAVLWRKRTYSALNSNFDFSNLLFSWCISYLIFGYASHTLYDWYWLFLFTLAAIFLKLNIRASLNDGKVN